MAVRARPFLSATILATALVLGPDAEARRAVTPDPSKVTGPAVTWSSGQQADRDCSRARRKFWLPQEGWIVRNVVSCR